MHGSSSGVAGHRFHAVACTPLPCQGYAACMRSCLVLISLLLAACGGDAVAPAATGSAVPANVPPEVSEWVLPVTDIAAQPDLITTPDGRLLLSWIAAEGGKAHVLRFASFDGHGWTAAKDIARGDDWFVNWADTPHIAATADGALWAHWLRQTAAAAYAYDVVLSRSGDGGTTWSSAIPINDDGTPTEHGFVSLWPQTATTVGVAWLDGRNTAAGEHAGHDGHGGGAMTLRAANVDSALRKSAETEIDSHTCDCCQTSAALTDRGALLVYRGRDPGEIRDILATRLQDGAWTSPRKVHDDQWTMPACPVNGPAVAARGLQAWVAWYTAAGDVPQLRIATSSDAGDRFGAPVVIDRGEAVHGRAGVAVDGDSVWVSWVREDAQGQSLWLARYPSDLSRELQRLQVASLQGRGRATGFPQLAAGQGGVYLAWTDVVDGKPQLRGARVAAQR